MEEINLDELEALFELKAFSELGIKIMKRTYRTVPWYNFFARAMIAESIRQEEDRLKSVNRKIDQLEL